MPNTPPPSSPSSPSADPPSPSSNSNKEKILSLAASHLEKANASRAAGTHAQEQASQIPPDVPNAEETKKQLLDEATTQFQRAEQESRAAHRLQSGVWQGGAAGAGLGAAVGGGVGAVLGTVVGGVLALPTAGVGGLVGVGAGAVHGPWVKLGTLNEKKGEGSEEGGDGAGEGEGEK